MRALAQSSEERVRGLGHVLRRFNLLMQQMGVPGKS